MKKQFYFKQFNLALSTQFFVLTQLNVKTVNFKQGVLCIPQSFSITEAAPSDCLVSYLGHSFGESYPSAEMQSVYSADSADRADCLVS